MFNKEFNLSFRPLVSHSCRKYEAYTIKIEAAESEAHTNNLKQELELHQRKASSACTGLQNDTKLTKNNPDDVTVISPEYTIEKIYHTFLVSGHSYLPCDSKHFYLRTLEKGYFGGTQKKTF
ncbi:Hypothetical protein CINCED_3A014872 [Cinara cedri]|uniref:Uncharacterized protein n=1 Tax=Cinara cedri TaxID=506608 RepID=A0A5E4M2W5_9HEMI|nr:Hypothetical protein CINCED_3A014872 [Cinara cedri]